MTNLDFLKTELRLSSHDPVLSPKYIDAAIIPWFVHELDEEKMDVLINIFKCKLKTMYFWDYRVYQRIKDLINDGTYFEFDLKLLTVNARTSSGFIATAGLPVN